jgi:hypothetical protein
MTRIPRVLLGTDARKELRLRVGLYGAGAKLRKHSPATAGKLSRLAFPLRR